MDNGGSPSLICGALNPVRAEILLPVPAHAQRVTSVGERPNANVLSYPPETVSSDKITRNIIVLSFSPFIQS